MSASVFTLLQAESSGVQDIVFFSVDIWGNEQGAVVRAKDLFSNRTSQQSLKSPLLAKGGLQTKLV